MNLVHRKYWLVCLAVLIGLAAGCGVTVNAPPEVITIISTFAPGTTGVPYSVALSASGGVSPYSWTVSAGTLPAGLTLSSGGVLSGTPTAPGTSTFTIMVTDSAKPMHSGMLEATLVVTSALKITTASPLTPGTLNTPYTATLQASGGTAPYTWTVSSGTVPPGLTLTTAGVLSGTPTAPGTSTFTVQATDSATTPQTATAPLTLVIGVAPLAITTTSLPAGTAGTAYSATLMASGGAPPYSWSVGSGGLPAGLTLSAAGVLSGTPGSASSTSPTFTVMDSGGNSASASLSLVIAAGGGTVPDNYYSFVFSGTAPQGADSTPSAFVLNGTIKIHSGQVVSGFFDENFNAAPPILKEPISGGSLVLGANGLGQLVLQTATNSITFALASPASVETGGMTPIRMIEYDDSTGKGARGSGVIDPSPASPTTGAISGNFAFLLSGTDSNQNQQALVGSFQTDGAGNLPAGRADANQVVPIDGVPTREVVSFDSIGGSYSVDADGRGQLTITIGTSAFHFSFYEVSPQEWLVISIDPSTLNSPLVSGMAYQQAGAPFSTASLPSLSVIEVSGVVPSNGETAPVPDISTGLAASDGSGNVTYTYDEYNGTLTSNTLTAAYTVDASSGRAVATEADPTKPTKPILYMINSNSALYLGADPSGQSGIIEAQSGSPFTNASFNGDYLGGSLPLAVSSVLNESGLVMADGAGNVSFTTYRSTATAPYLAYQSDAVVGTYTVDSTGRGVITTPDGTTRIFYVVSPTKIAYLTGDTGGYLGNFQQ